MTGDVFWLGVLAAFVAVYVGLYRSWTRLEVLVWAVGTGILALLACLGMVTNGSDWSFTLEMLITAAVFCGLFVAACLRILSWRTRA